MKKIQVNGPMAELEIQIRSTDGTTRDVLPELRRTYPHLQVQPGDIIIVTCPKVYRYARLQAGILHDHKLTFDQDRPVFKPFSYEFGPIGEPKGSLYGVFTIELCPEAEYDDAFLSFLRIFFPVQQVQIDLSTYDGSFAGYKKWRKQTDRID